jgi:hypothetical protein
VRVNTSSRNGSSGVRDEDLFQGIAQAQDGALLKQRTHVAQSFVEGRVCKECNNGWMSSLEKHVRSLLRDLMSGQRTLHALSAEERLLLARWTAKTAFVLSNAAPLDAVVPEDHPRTLKEITDTLPDNHRGMTPLFEQPLRTGGSATATDHSPSASRPGPRCLLPSYFLAISFRCQAKSVPA